MADSIAARSQDLIDAVTLTLRDLEELAIQVAAASMESALEGFRAFFVQIADAGER
jgi:hypothetical protein